MTARETALKALGAYRREKTWPEETFRKLTQKTGISAIETALALQIIKGVLQNVALIDYYAACFSSIKLNKLEPLVHDILRISIYQLVFLTKIPKSAAVDEGVTLTKAYSNPRAAGFVNAVLRKTADAVGSGNLPKIEADTEFKRLSIKYSHPEWLIRELFDVLDPENAEAFLKSNNAADIPITIQINTLLSSADETLSVLRAENLRITRHEWLEGCADIFGARRFINLGAYERGLFFVQDAASGLAVIAADPKPDDFVIDGCASPGGKSFAAAIAMQNNGRVVAFDLTDKKLSRITEGAKRLKLDIIEPLKADASLPDDRFKESADIVLADVPCSGFGVIRKKPDIRYKTENDVSGLPDIQKRILSNLSSYVKPGGTLLYSTCTFLKRENEDVIEWFLDNHRKFCTDEFSLPGIGRAKGGKITLWPQLHGTDGFFKCKMRMAE